jgi:hypothetical protein
MGLLNVESLMQNMRNTTDPQLFLPSHKIPLMGAGRQEELGRAALDQMSELSRRAAGEGAGMGGVGMYT